MKPEHETRAILDSLRRIIRELRVFSRQAEQHFGLTAAQLFVLQRVAEYQPLSVNALAELTLTHQSSVSVVAQRLEDRGLLSRAPAAQDRRRKDLMLTPAGRRVLREAPVSAQDRLIAAAGAMAPGDRADLARLLGQLVESLGLHETPPVLFFEPESGPGGVRRPDSQPTRRRSRRD